MMHAESMASIAMAATVVDLRANSLFCCGVNWNGSPGIMSYESINYSMPKLPSFLQFSKYTLYQFYDTDVPADASQVWGPMR